MHNAPKMHAKKNFFFNLFEEKIIFNPRSKPYLEMHHYPCAGGVRSLK